MCFFSILALSIGSLSLAFIAANDAWSFTNLSACLSLISSILVLPLFNRHTNKRWLPVRILVSIAISIVVVIAIQFSFFEYNGDMSILDDPRYATMVFYRSVNMECLLLFLIVVVLLVNRRALTNRYALKFYGYASYIFWGVVGVYGAILCEGFLKNDMFFQDIVICSLFSLFLGVIGGLLRLFELRLFCRKDTNKTLT